MTDNSEIDTTIEDSLIVKNDEGLTVVQVGLLGTLYFEDAHTPVMREAVLACFDAYWDLCGEHLHWVTHPKTHQWKPIEKIKEHPRHWILARNENESWQLSYQGGASQKEASHFRFEVLGTPAWERESVLSYLHFCLPITFFADREGGLPELLLDFAGRLNPVHGYAGLGLIESYDSNLRFQYEPAVYGMSQRFPGLEVDYPTAHSIYGKTGIKSVNWLTVLANDLLASLGGTDRICEQLGDEYLMHAYPGGAIIQAGPRPQLGDRNRDRWPDRYVKLAHLVEPIRLKDHRSFHEYGINRFTLESTAEWLARFDDINPAP